MALGGGTWMFQNKVLPGAYINFESAVRASVSVAARGYAAVPITLSWGKEGEVFSVEASEFLKNSIKYFGYSYASDEMKPLRDLFKNLDTGYFYRLSNDAVKAKCTFAEAVCGGVRGNDIKVSIQANVDDPSAYTVSTYILDEGDLVKVDEQTIKAREDFVPNDYIRFLPDTTGSATIDTLVTAGVNLTGGTDGTAATAANYQTFLDKVEPYYFNILCCPATTKEIKDLFIQFTKRMRDEIGMKFQCVVYDYNEADYEGIISIMNGVKDEGENLASLVYWLTGAEAACPISGTLTNKTYDGDYTVDVNYTQTQLEQALQSGNLILHRVTDPTAGDVAGQVNVLLDNNTFTSFTKTKNEDFSKNQVIRVLDQIAIDFARLFNRIYLGKEPNDNDGRIALWSDLCAYLDELQRVRAIQNFLHEDVPIPLQGATKEAVTSEVHVQPTCCMEKLYMTVTVA